MLCLKWTGLKIIEIDYNFKARKIPVKMSPRKLSMNNYQMNSWVLYFITRGHKNNDKLEIRKKQVFNEQS